MQTATATKLNLQSVDRISLEQQVKDMYQRVAENPNGEFHFEMGRALCERLGYKPADLDSIPAEAIKSFAGVGYYFHLADLKEGESVLDLGSGSGTDTFIAALQVGASGHVTGVDMTDAQRAKAEELRDEIGFTHVDYLKSYIEDLPLDDASYDAVISNGVFNLSPEKDKVFQEIVRVLKPGGRLAISDIVTEQPLPEGISCSADLWAACIGGAMQEDAYCQAIEVAGLSVVKVEPMPYEFISDNATGAAEKWGVKAVSLLATKPA
jgi:arsenite methyltransferase